MPNKAIKLGIVKSSKTDKWLLAVQKPGGKPQVRATFDTKEEAQTSLRSNAESLKRNGYTVKVGVSKK